MIKVNLAYGTVDFAGQVFGCHAVPLFHGMGAFEVTIAVSHPYTCNLRKLTVPQTGILWYYYWRLQAPITANCAESRQHSGGAPCSWNRLHLHHSHFPRGTSHVQFPLFLCLTVLQKTWSAEPESLKKVARAKAIVSEA